MKSLVLKVVFSFNRISRTHLRSRSIKPFDILAILERIGVVNAPGWVTWTALIAVLAVGFGLEYIYKAKRELVTATRPKLLESSGIFCSSSFN